MKSVVAAALLLAGSMAAAQAQEIRYERIFPMIQGEDNRLVITITEDNEVIVNRPAFMTHAGRHTFQLDNGQRMSIQSEVQALTLNISSENLHGRVNLRGANELTHISDEEITVIRVFNSDRKVEREVWARGVAPWAEAFGDDRELQDLARFEHDMWSLMDTLMTSGRNSNI